MEQVEAQRGLTNMATVAQRTDTVEKSDMFLPAVKCKTHCGRRVFSYNYLVVLCVPPTHLCSLCVCVEILEITNSFVSTNT